jgi:hypothetical protein
MVSPLVIMLVLLMPGAGRISGSVWANVVEAIKEPATNVTRTAARLAPLVTITPNPATSNGEETALFMLSPVCDGSTSPASLQGDDLQVLDEKPLYRDNWELAVFVYRSRLPDSGRFLQDAIGNLVDVSGEIKDARLNYCPYPRNPLRICKPQLSHLPAAATYTHTRTEASCSIALRRPRLTAPSVLLSRREHS